MFKLFFFLSLLISSNAKAVSIGEISVDSHINQKLSAEVSLTDISPKDKSSLFAKLGSQFTYKSMGLEYPKDISFKFELKSRMNGDLFFTVNSDVIINDPIISIVVELNWSSGKQVKPFTVFLDPIPESHSEIQIIPQPPIVIVIQKQLIFPKQIVEVQKISGKTKPILINKEVKSEDKQETYLSFNFCNEPAKVMIERARSNFSLAKYEDVLKDMNTLLLCPKNEYSEESQELIGTTFEKIDELDKAKNEYKLFLSAYPNSEHYKKVQQSLMRLEIIHPDKVANVKDFEYVMSGSESSISGFSSIYYETGIPKPISTNGKITGSYRYNQYQSKFVTRLSSNSRAKAPNIFLELSNLSSKSSIKIGRQDPGSGFAIGRFDGISTKYYFNDSIQGSTVIGKPYLTSSKSNRIFYGSSLDFSKTNKSFGFYYTKQFADKILERSAIGSHGYYSDNGIMAIGSLEYDTLYKDFNVLMFQSTMQLENEKSLYVLFDRRKSPILYADQALKLGINHSDKIYDSVGDIFAHSTLSNEEIYKFIDKTTPISSSYVAGLTKNLSNIWTVSGDVQLTNMSSTYDPYTSTSILNISSSGISNNVNLKLIGSNVFDQHDAHQLIFNESKDKVSRRLYSLTIFNGKTFTNGTKLDIINKAYTKNYVDTGSFVLNQRSYRKLALASSIKLNTKINEDSSIESQYSFYKTFRTKEANVNSFFIGYQRNF